MNRSTIYCNNCGNEGHLYRQCRLPVLSYGILCINKDKILMIQRKDSLSYIEFLRGKYALDNLNYVSNLLNRCSKNELLGIQQKTFDELWEKLWFSGKKRKKQTERMIQEYENSKKLFGQLKKRGLSKLVESCSNNYPTPEWEFPKGRRNNREANLQCAIREFEEETDLDSSEYTIIENALPLTEEYVGTNGVRYKHIYYYALYVGNKQLTINRDKYEQYSEIGDISWLSIDDAFSKIRKEQPTKLDILNKLKSFMEYWKRDFNIKD